MLRSRPLAAAAVLAVVPLALADASTKPTLTAPASAKLGSSFRVVAKNLKPDRYAVRLFARTSPNPDWVCVAQLAPQTKKKVTSLSVRVKLPAKLNCYSGFPASYESTIPATAGKYSVVVSVPQAVSTTAAHGNVVIGRITLR